MRCNMSKEDEEKAGIIGAGVAASAITATAKTMSGADMMDTLATMGGGSAAAGAGILALVPVAAYGLARWLYRNW